MATVSATDITKTVKSDGGNASTFYGTYTGTPATGDVWRMCKVPAGFKVTETVIINADLGTAAPADFGYDHIDGSTGDDDNAFGDDLALGTASAGTIAYFADAPVAIEKDSFITLTFGTINTGASGKVSVLVKGELFGAK